MSASDPPETSPKGRVSHAQVLEALEVRYDHQSARNVLDEALRRVQMQAAPDYSPEEASRIVWGLNEVGPKVQKAVMRLLELAGAAATHDVPEDPADPADPESPKDTKAEAEAEAEAEAHRLFWN